MAEGATCSYIDPQLHESDFICPACHSEIPPNKIVQQSCACRLRACDSCLLTWAEVRRRLNPPLLPSCFQCRQTLDLSSLRLDVSAGSVIGQIPEHVTQADIQADFEILGQEMFDRVRQFLLRYHARTSQLLGGVSSQRRAALANRQTVFINEPTRQNTIYIDGEGEEPEYPINEMILIRIDCDFPNTIDRFFVWAHPDTSLDLLEKRLKAYAIWTRIFERSHRAWVNWAFSPDDPTVTVTWTINGQNFDRCVLPRSNILSQLGLVNGSQLRISFQEQSL